MNLNTPLPEVARLLPAASAAFLDEEDYPVQVNALVGLRFLISQWEQSGVTLDPITLAEIVNPVTVLLATIHRTHIEEGDDNRGRQGP